ncbi:MAG TPA: ABC transporter ATP-binding protein, partial [Ktedonobacteraceae bacterium]|nr:ABC transporter ATP-binding protein [Ktedonobacteraceae bacterium]
ALLILDDSTSAVDAETEYQIQQALQRLMAKRTSFIIAQRISTVRNANQILLIDQGKLVAQGTHEELMESSGLYCELLESQMLNDETETAA